jgi:hypothetical protein
MVDREGEPNDEVWPVMGPHEEFLELSALSTTGNLTAEEWNRLEEHLASCSACREAMKQFETVVDKVIPALAPELARDTPEENPSFSVEKAEVVFFQRLSTENAEPSAHSSDESPSSSPSAVAQTGSRFGPMVDRFHFWLPLAAVLLLCLTLGILAYKTGVHRGVIVARQEQGMGTPVPTGVAVEAVNRDRDSAYAELTDRDKAIRDLRSQIALQSAEIAKLKGFQSARERDAETSREEKKQLAEERDRLRNKCRPSRRRSRYRRKS